MNIVEGVFKAELRITWKENKTTDEKYQFTVNFVVVKNGVPDFHFHLINAGRDGYVEKRVIRSTSKRNIKTYGVKSSGAFVKNGYKKAISKFSGFKYQPRIDGAQTIPETYSLRTVDKTKLGYGFYVKKGDEMAGWYPRNYYKLFAEDILKFFRTSSNDILFGNSKNKTYFEKDRINIVNIENKHK